MGAILGKPKTPAIPEPKELPDPDDQGLLQRKRQDAARRIQASGRASTIVSDTAENKPVGR